MCYNSRNQHFVEIDFWRQNSFYSLSIRCGLVCGHKYIQVLPEPTNADALLAMMWSKVTMTTTNLTTVCYYGVQRNTTDNPVWTPQICGEEETSCMLLSDNSTGFKLAACYDPTYNDGK